MKLITNLSRSNILWRNFSTGIGSNTKSCATKPDVFQRVMKIFPEDMQMVFAYGSGVFQQSGSDMSRNMLDFIFVVDDPWSWHSENIQRNPKHYSTLFRWFPARVAPFQERYGAGVFCNTLVPFENRLFKYGVISTERLVSDLRNWDTLYVSGRLHKPVNFVISPTSHDLSKALSLNLRNALHASLLLLPAEFTEEQLFIKIASLSYSGDFRMVVGEDKGKVKKLVEPNMMHFKELYANVIDNEKYLFRRQNSFEQSKCDESCLYHLRLLPNQVLDNLPCFYKEDPINQDVFLNSLASDKDVHKYTAQAISKIVKDSSIWQSLKNIPTAGFRKTVVYSGAKLKKMVKGMLPK